MRLDNFGGLLPSVTPTQLDRTFAVVAENCRVRTKAIEPLQAPMYVANIVTPLGSLVDKTKEVKTLHISDGVHVGFYEYTDIAIDNRNINENESFYFAFDGKLMRTSGSRITSGLMPEIIGLPAPCLPPELSLVTGKPARVITEECYPQLPLPAPCDLPAPPVATVYQITYSRTLSCGNTEESAPSKVSEIIDVTDKTYAKLTFSAVHSALTSATHINIYRSVAGKNGSVAMLYVDTIPISQTSYTDTVNANELGYALQTTGMYQPLNNIKGVFNYGNNCIGVYSGRTIQVSEPWLHHAYRVENTITLPTHIEAVRSIISWVESEPTYTSVAVTKDKNYFISGGLPEKSTVSESQASYPILNKRSLCVAEGAIYYLCAEGIVSISDGQTNLLLSDYANKDDLARMNIENMLLAYDSHEFVTTIPNTGHSDGNLLLPYQRMQSVKQTSDLTTHTISFSSSYYSSKTGLVIAIGHTAHRWATGDDMTYRWLSVPLVHAGLWKPTAIKAIYDQKYENVQGWQDTKECKLFNIGVRLSIIRDGSLAYERDENTYEYHRLPQLRRAINWQIGVTSAKKTYELHIDASFTELTKD